VRRGLLRSVAGGLAVCTVAGLTAATTRGLYVLWAAGMGYGVMLAARGVFDWWSAGLISDVVAHTRRHRRDRGEFSTLEVATALGRSPEWVRYVLRALEEDGLLVSRSAPGGAERGYRPRRLYHWKTVEELARDPRYKEMLDG